MWVVRSTPEEQHADQDEGRGNRIPDKVHPMYALTATKPGVFVLDIKTNPALYHLTNQPRQKSSTETSNVVVPHRTIYNQSFDLRKFGGMSIILEISKTAHEGAADNNLSTPLLHRLRSKQICGRDLSIR